MRICSFLPSATETICALGLGDELCGVTSECDYPTEARSKPIVVESAIEPSELTQGEIDAKVVEGMSHGHQLYAIDTELLSQLRPDLIVTQELCDVCSVSLRDVLKTVSELSRTCKVVSLKPRGLAGVLDDILTIGRACGAEEQAGRMVAGLHRRIEFVRTHSRDLPRPRVFCVEWYDPIFASGHWVPEMVEAAGGTDGLGRKGENSRRIEWSQLRDYDPEVLILSPCGFGIQRAVEDVSLLTRLEGWTELDAVRNGRVYATDSSSYFSRPGPRLVDGLELLARVIHPTIFGAELPEGAALRVSERILSADLSAD